MDFQDEAQVGRYTYGVKATRQPAEDLQPESIVVEFTGGDADGRIIAEGNLLISLDALVDSNVFLARTLGGLAALHGKLGTGRGAARSRPPKAGQPWSETDGELLRQRWLASSHTTPAQELLSGLAEELGRTRAGVRAHLPRLGCDPDVPGRAMAAAEHP